MKRILTAFSMCQTMFCAIPFPGKWWDEKARPLMLLFLPLVGLEIGILWALLGWVTAWLKLPVMLGAVLLCAWPYFATGFIHLDGFMDVVDAVKSWRSLERRREILKDSHVGSFSVIAMVLLVAFQLSAFASVEQTADWRILALVPVVSRCCSALAVTGLKPMSTSQYADQKMPKGHLLILAAMLTGCLVLGFTVCGRYGLVLLGCIAGYGYGLQRGYRSLEGMNGDISGYALTLGELCGAIVMGLL